MADTSKATAHIGRIMNLELRVRNAELALNDARHELNEEREALQKAVVAGEKTGDPFRDRFVALHGWSPELEPAYRALEQELKGHKGEFVLLAYSHEVRMPGGIFRSESYRTARYFRLAVLEGETFGTARVQGWFKEHDVDNFCIPISRYIEGEVEPYPTAKKLEVVKDGLFAQWRQEGREPPPVFSTFMLERAGLWSGSETRFNNRHLYAHDVELVVGDKAVQAWLAKVAMADIYKPAAAALSKLILEPTEG